MLVLSRKPGTRIRIGNDIIVTIVEIRDNKVRVGIEAPRQIPVHREEVWELLHAGDDAKVREPKGEAKGAA